MTDTIFKYYVFEEPYNCLMIARNEDEAAFAYESEVSDCWDGACFEELSQLDFIERLAATETEAMPTIERGLMRAAIDTQNALFHLVETGEHAKILSVSPELISNGRRDYL